MPRGPRFAPATLVFVALLTLCALTGCGGHLIGTRDVELEYHTAVAGSEGDADDLVSRATERMRSAEIAADVRAAAGGRLYVLTDESSAEEADEVLTWRGGLQLYVVDPSFSVDVARVHRSELTVATDEAGTDYVRGPPSAVARLARSMPPVRGHRLVSDASAGPVARSRAVFDPPVADLTSGVTAAEADGATLHLGLTDGGRATLASAAMARDGADVAFVRDVSVLAVAPIRLDEDGRLSVFLGDTPRAYARAETAARLLRTPPLPRLVRAGFSRMPPEYPLAIAELLLPLLLSLGWLAFVRRFDRARPEPLWLVLVTFVLGGAAVVPASAIEWKLAELSPYTNPQLMTFGGRLAAFPLAFVALTLTVGLVEEGAKLLAAWVVATKRREFDEPVDGIVYSSAAALGFAAVENLRYFAAGRMSGTVVVTRAFMSAPAHFLFSALWGYALGKRLVDKQQRVWPLFVASMLAHAAFDTCLSFPATSRAAPLVNFALATGFVVMLRRALRHGPVQHGPSEERGKALIIRVGSRAAFGLCVAGLHAAAALTFVLGVYVEQTHARIGGPFLVVSTLLVVLVAALAYGVSASLPLDVVLDDDGVTFAGAFLAWRDVAEVERPGGRGGPGRTHRLLVRGRTANLSLGPADRRAIEALAAAVHERWSRAAEPLDPT